ncbi:MAG: hypothetical protein AB7O96_15075 [Pseudobdellovibrionaceae bacterium]
MSKFEFQTTANGEELNGKLVGVIDEDVDFAQYNLTPYKKIDLDLSGIKSINSCGIREWILWMSTAKDASVVFNECPKIIVDQINMVQGFLPANGRVQSFQVPYYSEESDEEKNILFTFGKEFDDTGVHPPANIQCSKGTPMEMDVLEARYFKFIKK